MHLCSAVRALLLFAVLAIVAPSGRARACDVQLEGQPSAAWRETVRELPARAGGDCAGLILRVASDEARLIFVTQDGRRAERVLAGPEELAPSIAALSEAGPGEPAPAAAASPRAEPAAPPARDLAVLGSLLGGARVGQYRLVSPIVSGSLLMRIRRWELGAVAAWETGYYHGSVDRGTEAETTSLTFARRQPLDELTLLAGLRLGMAVRLHTERPVFAFADSDLYGGSLFLTPPRLQGRLGPFVGFSWPRSATGRLRFELGVELAFPSTSSFLVRWPVWAFALSVGVELGKS